MTQRVWRKVEEMTPEQWMSWRRNGIGGSDAPAIMGVSPWSTPYQKWKEKVHDERSDDNACKKFGRDTENNSRMEFEDLIGARMLPANVENIKHPWLRASLDGLNEKFEFVVEIKKTNREDHKKACEGIVPEKYWPQCQHIMLVTGKVNMYYFSSPACGSYGKVLNVLRDNSYIDNELFPKLKEFWEMVKAKTPPPLEEKDLQPLLDPVEWEKVSAKWKKITALINRLEEKETFTNRK